MPAIVRKITLWITPSTQLGSARQFLHTAHLALSFVRLLRCNDGYIVHYAPVIAPRSQTKCFAIRVNYFLWGAREAVKK
ncbi:MAG: hypothetical protein BECKG1743D_GA0114223_101812 [Candidatus Kentron sp. G]|nr:MAG: hypothetical protein BECKG1743F_GA0114225_101412 [Candidatus Kentron sp. G]VFN00284.1 MAG: hypothetical protein BECKG1743D_GA0114223_101812 [Candidatus Kentron sp. G]VFN02352.1 MAG: hypothetical protein BECKG1743E_GA0114224_104973 [Candidatus Kentron sp. G]